MNAGTNSIPTDGSSPKAIATSSGARPYTPAFAAIHDASATTSSWTSTGVARIASYERWNTRRTNVWNIAVNAVENSTAVATTPVPRKSMYGTPTTTGTRAPRPIPKASR